MSDKNEMFKVCRCPIQGCGRSVNITDWNGEDSIMCGCCYEQFEWEEVYKDSIKYVENTKDGLKYIKKSEYMKKNMVKK